MKGVDTFKAGIFVAVSLTLFVVSVWVMGTEREIFSRQQKYTSTFSDVKGLHAGAPVRLGGITIGRVDDITFAKDPKDSRIDVQLLINERYLDRIRNDSEVTLETQGLLGDRFVSISVGKEPGVMAPGSTIPSVEHGEITDVLSKAGTVVDNTVQISENLKGISESFKKDAAKDISEGMKSLNEVAKNIRELTKEVRAGQGLAHSLVYDPAGKDTISAFTQAATNLASTALEIGDIARQIKSGKGTAHDFVYSNDNGDQSLGEVVKKLNETAENLKKASEALKDGSGTIGALLVDSKLYDNLVEVTDGAKRSLLLREAVRSSLSN